MRAGVGGAAWTWPYKTAYAKNKNHERGKKRFDWGGVRGWDCQSL